tara:strand:+ start:188 stop:436 length:249 start_codon:yes stop_codon:yes gene_type:complete
MLIIKITDGIYPSTFKKFIIICSFENDPVRGNIPAKERHPIVKIIPTGLNKVSLFFNFFIEFSLYLIIKYPAIRNNKDLKKL